MARKAGPRAAVTTPRHPRRARVAALVRHDPASEIVMRAAAEIARRSEGDLLGLFLEDTELLHLAEMPFAREVCFSSASLLDLDIGRMERSLRVAARHTRARFEKLAGGAQGRSFRVARGELLETLLSTASEADVVLTSVSTPGRGYEKKGPLIVLSLKMQPRDLLVVLGDVAGEQHLAIDAILPVEASAQVLERRDGMRVFRAGCLEDAEGLLRRLLRRRAAPSAR